jgi:hypothetical protein
MPIVDLDLGDASEKSLLASEVFNDDLSSSKSGSESEASSSLCSSELDELDELSDREERGDGISEESLSKLRDLDLFDQYKVGDDLNDVYMKLLNDFRSRRKDRQYCEELEALLSTIIGCSVSRCMLVELVVKPFRRMKLQPYRNWTIVIPIFPRKVRRDPNNSHGPIEVAMLTRPLSKLDLGTCHRTIS